MRIVPVGSIPDDSLVGTADDIARIIDDKPEPNDQGAFRAVFFNTDHSAVYKLAHNGQADDNMREYRAMRDLYNCDCGIARYITKTTLWMIVETATLIVAMEYIAYDSFPAASDSALREMMRVVRNHNAHCSGAKIMDLLEDNYRVDLDGNIHITDCNLDESEYGWLVETDHSGRCQHWTMQ